VTRSFLAKRARAIINYMECRTRRERERERERERTITQSRRHVSLNRTESAAGGTFPEAPPLKSDSRPSEVRGRRAETLGGDPRSSHRSPGGDTEGEGKESPARLRFRVASRARLRAAEWSR